MKSRGPVEHPRPSLRSVPSEKDEWRRQMLYHNRIRTDLNNERKYLGWLGVSLGMISLGFVVERVDLFLARMGDRAGIVWTPMLRWAPLLIFGVGAVMIATATWEYFADRRRILRGEDRRSVLLVALVLMTLVALVVVAGLLLVAQPA